MNLTLREKWILYALALRGRQTCPDIVKLIQDITTNKWKPSFVGLYKELDCLQNKELITRDEGFLICNEFAPGYYYPLTEEIGFRKRFYYSLTDKGREIVKEIEDPLEIPFNFSTILCNWFLNHEKSI